MVTEAWQDEFDGAEGAGIDSALWALNLGAGGWGNNELQEYTADNVALDGASHLAISATITTNADGSTAYRSSSIVTTQAFSYGTLSARITLPTGQGLLPAFWLLGSNIGEVGWPQSGEIDVVETPNDTSTSHHNIHGPSASGTDVVANASTDHVEPLGDDWHVYAVTRTPGNVRISIDGVLVASLTEATMPDGMEWVFDDAPFRALFTLAIGGNWPGDPDETTPAVSTMLIDWMRFEPAAG
ncbi:glycoside hydrolase family 16 protein [Conyzicola lurida]